MENRSFNQESAKKRNSAILVVDRSPFLKRAPRTHVTILAIGAACGLAQNQLRLRLAALESHGLVGSCQDFDSKPLRRAHYVTAEGRWAARNGGRA